MNMGYLIEGSNVHVFKYLDATPFEIVCGTDVVVEFVQELIGATTPESGRTNEVRPRMRNVNCVISGATTSTNDGNYSVFSFLDDDVFEGAQDLEVVYTDNLGNEKSIRSDFYIETLLLTGPAGSASTYDIKLRGSGPYTATVLPDPEVTGETVESRTFTIASGEVQHADLVGVNIIAVYREGTELTSMALVAPYTYNSGTGTITPDPDTTIDGQKLFVIWTF